jgi:hypothetical protein
MGSISPSEQGSGGERESGEIVADPSFGEGRRRGLARRWGEHVFGRIIGVAVEEFWVEKTRPGEQQPTQNFEGATGFAESQRARLREATNVH